jgi:hypothetical protein
MAKAARARETTKKTCSKAGSRLTEYRSSRAGKHLGGYCKKRAKAKKR